jgi:hypothetical protein
MSYKKGQAPIIVLFRVFIAIIGLGFLFWGMGDLKNGITGATIGANLSTSFSNSFIGIIKIIVGLVLVVLGIHPESLTMIVHAIFRI